MDEKLESGGGNLSSGIKSRLGTGDAYYRTILIYNPGILVPHITISWYTSQERTHGGGGHTLALFKWTKDHSMLAKEPESPKFQHDSLQ